jgi:predicted nucleic acid-binding protein
MEWLAVAHRFDAALVTADRPLYERAKSHFPKMSMLPGCEKN